MAASSPAQVAKLVDAGDSKSPAARCVGSSPTLGTTTAFRAVIFLSIVVQRRKPKPGKTRLSAGLVPAYHLIPSNLF